MNRFLSTKSCKVNRFLKAFTLSELLIAVAVLGLIATFTIPKVLVSVQGSANNTKAKQAATLLRTAIVRMEVDGGELTADTTWPMLATYINHTKELTGVTLDGWVTDGWSITCGSDYLCLQLHDGSVLYGSRTQSFGGTSNLNTLTLSLDVDAAFNGERSLSLITYYNGLVRTRSTAVTGSINSGGFAYGPISTADPDWFHW